jgi:hypothetical protein
MFHSVGLAELVVIGVLYVAPSAVTVIPCCRITERTGYSGWWGLLGLLPFGTLVWACFMAFSKWPRDASQR